MERNPGRGHRGDPARGPRRAALMLLVLAWGGAGVAQAEGVGFGVHAGYTSLKGNVFPGSGDLDGTPLLGLHAVIPVIPLVSVVIAGEGRSQEFTFDQAGAESALEGKAEWTERVLLASARLRVLPLGVGPAGLYAGAGLGYHFQEIEVRDVSETVPGKTGAQSAGAVDDFIDEVEDTVSEFSYHLLAGLSVSIRPLPLTVFGEIRFDGVNGKYTPDSRSVYGGATLQF